MPRDVPPLLSQSGERPAHVPRHPRRTPPPVEEKDPLHGSRRFATSHERGQSYHGKLMSVAGIGLLEVRRTQWHCRIHDTTTGFVVINPATPRSRTPPPPPIDWASLPRKKCVRASLDAYDSRSSFYDMRNVGELSVYNSNPGLMRQTSSSECTQKEPGEHYFPRNSFDRGPFHLISRRISGLLVPWW